MSERMRTILLLLVVGVIVIIIYQITTSSLLQPLTPTATSLKQQVFPPLIEANNISTETDRVIQKDLFGQWKSIKIPEKKMDIKPDAQVYFKGIGNITDSGPVKYAVISASTPTNTQDPNSYNYVFDLPLTVMAWERIGFRSIVLIPGSKTKWEESSVLRLIHSYLQDLRAIVIFIEAKEDNVVMLSQTARLFVCCLSDVKSDDYLVTSDSDLWPINPEKYVLPPGKVLLSTYAHCCGVFSHKSGHYHMIPMASIGAKSSTWREIMFGDDNNNKCINMTAAAILDYFAKEFGPMVYNPTQKGDNDGWYLDQHMASVRIEHWIRKHNDLSILEFPSRDLSHDRLDRSYWYPRSLGSLTDTHLLEQLYRTGEWARVQPVLYSIYGQGTSYFSLCQRYRQDFVAELKASLKVTM